MTWQLAGAAMVLGLASGAAAQDGQYAYLGASLFGTEEVGGNGAPDPASADFSAEIDLKGGEICYLLELNEIADFAAAHIHEGARGRNGPPVVTLQLAGDDGEDVCQAVDPEVLAKIAKRPGSYYVNVHTEAFPTGAVRGQLRD
ncbi:CHRD domain-containing protein [Altererythrobacter sp. MF3-039]|uniref:CHRD domain-containing protein n=1 Tax=Altererythrobacter sp. MF3-039 TaxID=3252901 RepID=UPI00390CA486